MKPAKHCPCSGDTLARLLQPAVMTALAAGPAHGYEIMQSLRQRALFRDCPPDQTGVYRLLRQMEKRALMKSQWHSGEAGPAQRKYMLTSEGRKCLARWRDTLERYLEEIADLLKAANSCTPRKI